MGYDTRYSGRFKIEPPLGEAQAALMQKFTRDQRDDFPHNNGWCDWLVSDDGSSIGHNGNEKSYEAPEALNYLATRFVTPLGSEITGHVECRVEAGMGVPEYRLVAKNGVVREQHPTITYGEDEDD